MAYRIFNEGFRVTAGRNWEEKCTSLILFALLGNCPILIVTLRILAFSKLPAKLMLSSMSASQKG